MLGVEFINEGGDDPHHAMWTVKGERSTHVWSWKENAARSYLANHGIYIDDNGVINETI